jgi:proline iminopeptidase
MKEVQGRIKVRGGRVWYKIVGNRKGTPIITIHGGPGYPHDYLKPLEDLSANRQVIFYDQLGCGNSDRLEDKSLWTVDKFVSELEGIIANLGLKKYHLFGQSWGTALGTAFALKKPKGLISLVLSDPYLSTPRWEDDARHLLRLLPKSDQTAISDYEKCGKISKGYRKANKKFYDRFVYRFDNTPREIGQAFKKANRGMYRYMWGPSEFIVEGTLKNFDLTPKLHRITIPVLLLCGRYDEARPDSARYFARRFPNARVKVFKNSAHFPFWTDRKEYMKTVQEFFDTVETYKKSL